MTFLADPPHGWIDGHSAGMTAGTIRGSPNKGITTMTYHLRRSSVHYALADAFTICDAYHCSVLGPTDRTGTTC